MKRSLFSIFKKQPSVASDIPSSLYFPKKHQDHHKTWLSVGMKLILGVGLASNLCMVVLIYSNFTAGKVVGEKTNDLLALNAGLNQELRAEVGKLQQKYLEIPKLLQTDDGERVVGEIKHKFKVAKEETLTGRSQYGRFFDRNQRRDISKGEFVVQVENGRITISKGRLDESGAFTDQVYRLYIEDADSQGMTEQITAFVRQAVLAGRNGDAIKQKIARLNGLLADEALAAEVSRTRILYHVEEIASQEKHLIHLRQDTQKNMILIACATMAINLLVLYVMTFRLVEQPLTQLTRNIREINLGKTVVIPFQNRKDNIGVLAGALKSFQDAVKTLRREDTRKQSEKQLIQELIHTMTGLIADLQEKATAMKTTAFDLHGLAADTNDQSEMAEASTSRTMENMASVCQATQMLSTAVQNIGRQMSRQNELVIDISQVTRESLGHITHLTKASREIEKIIKIVQKIAGQTRLLALNARIEAARAGEAGRGFKVVANEVRDLSLQTEEANQEIGEKICAIQSASQQMIKSVQKIETQIITLTEVGTHIGLAVEEQGGITRRITQNTTQTGQDIQDLSQRMVIVKQAAQQTSLLSENLKSHSLGMAASLTDLLSETRGKLSTMANASLTIP